MILKAFSNLDDSIKLQTTLLTESERDTGPPHPFIPVLPGMLADTLLML